MPILLNQDSQANILGGLNSRVGLLFLMLKQASLTIVFKGCSSNCHYSPPSEYLGLSRLKALQYVHRIHTDFFDVVAAFHHKLSWQI